ncbi:MAG: zeta toxin family protein [Bacteroidia bacterium]
MRVFAGPNGSGKSTIFNQISSKFDIGVYINADEIEIKLRTEGYLELNDYLINVNEKTFLNYLKNHTLLAKAKEEGLNIKLNLSENVIHAYSDKISSYEAALISDIIRRELIKSGIKFTYETVMSHQSKIETFELANKNKYKTYLYFICTSSPQINLERVKSRVSLEGHYVPENKIIERYYKSLDLLKLAVSKTYRTYIWDNSGVHSKFILEVFNGVEVRIGTNDVPEWVEKYLLK